MLKNVFIALFIILLSVIFDALTLEIDDLSNEFLKRQMIPFPRQGRDMFKRQGLIPSPRVGRGSGLIPSPRVGRAGGLIPSPRVGRGSGLIPSPRVGRGLLKRQGLIPSPRVGRASFAHLWPNVELSDLYGASTDMHENNALYSLGRSKRSTNENGISTASEGDQMNQGTSSDADSGRMQSLYTRNVRQLIPAPRVGRRSDTNSHDDNIFVAGALRAYAVPIDDDSYDAAFGKSLLFAPEIMRRASFTPRIGRSFTPRIGRGYSDAGDEYLIASRMARASFTPRIGRSIHSDKNAADDGQADNKTK